MKTLYTQLEETNEDEGIYTMGDDILDTFMNGNFSAGVEDLQEFNISPIELSDYLTEKAEEYGMSTDDLYYGHFTSDFWIALGGAM